MSYQETLEFYNKLVNACPNFERKGKTMPYTSANGYMFSLLNKAGELGFRLSKDSQTVFKEKYNSTIFKSYGAVMRDYVLVPEHLYNEFDLLVDYLNESYNYVMFLEPK